MDLTPHVDELRRQLAVAAEAGGEDARELAERLTAPLESAVRLTLLNVLSAAMDEVTRELAPGSVEVRLRGLDPAFVVAPPPAEESFGAGDATVMPPQPEPDDESTARINLRLPGRLKTRAEESAARQGVSLNTWLVRAVGSALEPEDRGPRRRGTPFGGQHFTGWVS